MSRQAVLVDEKRNGPQTRWLGEGRQTDIVPTTKEADDKGGRRRTHINPFEIPTLFVFDFSASLTPVAKGAHVTKGLVKKAGGGSKVPAGEKLRFRINRAVEDEGDHGPQVRLDLEVLGGEYRGAELREWCKVGEDEETGEQYIADGGKLHNIMMAAFEGNVQFLDSLESIDDVVGALEGKSFVSITKSEGKTGDYTGITWDMVYVDQKTPKKKPPNQQDVEEDFDDLDFGEDNPKAPF